MSRPTKDKNPEIETLRRDNESLRAQLEEFRESHEALCAVRNGEVDALVVSAPEGDRIFTLESAEQPYRLLIEQMQEAAVTLGPAGTIQYANRALAQMLQRPLEQVIGSAVKDHVAAADQPALAALLVQPHGPIAVALQAADGTCIPVQASASVVGPDRAACISLVMTDLTERQRAEQRLRATFDNAASGIIEADEQDRLVAVNDRFCHMLGYAREQLLGRSIHDLTYPEDRPRSEQLNAQIHQGQSPMLQYEKRYLKRDGSPLWVQAAVSAVRDDTGHYLYSVATIVDISARKAAEAQVRLQAAALEGAANAISVSQTDPQGTIVWVNPAFTTLTGYSAQEIVGHSHHLLSSGRQDQAFYRDLWETIRRGEVWRGELTNRRKDGTIYYEEMGITPLRDEAGKITHYVAIKQDITSRKLAELALRESERQLRFVCESIPHLVWAARPDGHIDYVNQRALDYTGAGQEELTGWGWLPFIHPEDRLQTAEQWKTALREGSEVRLTYRLRHGPSREYRWHAVHALPLRDGEGRILRWYGTCTDVDEQKRAEDALRRSEAKYRTLFENMGEEVHFWELVRDRAGRIQTWRLVDANPAALRTWGRSLDEIRGKTTDEIFGPGSTDHFMPVVQQVTTEGTPYSFEDYFAPLGKTFRFTTVSLGEYFITTGADITEQRRGEAALRGSEQRFRGTFENAAVGIAHIDREGRFIRVNQKFRQMLGYWCDELRGRTFAELTHPEDRQEDLAQYQALMRGEAQSYVLEKRFLRADGTVVWVQVTRSVQRDDAGRPAWCISIVQEITQRKQAEEALRDSERRYSALFANKTNGIAHGRVITDEHGTPIDYEILEVNDAYEQITGVRKADIEGRRVREMFPGIEKFPFDYISTLGRIALEGGEITFEDFFAPLNRWLSIYAYSPSRGEFITLLTDVTAQKIAQQELKAAKESAEQASQAKDHFLAVLSHELRTPLSPVLATVTLLQNDGRFNQDTQEGLEVIRRNAELEARLIDDLLDVTRIARGKVELDRQPIQLCTIIQHAVEVCRPDIETRRLHFGVDIRDGPHLVNADAARLQQVFWNLLRNSVKFTPVGGCVGIRCWRADGQIVVEVNDSGEGIEPEALPRIFNAFEQAERSITRHFGGLGLGLTISKAMVEMHGGRIEARSPGKGQGATFTVRLPLLAAGTVVAAISPGSQAPPPAALARPLRILLVEDHGDTAKVMKRVLTSQGHQVRTAGDVASALDLASQHPFDLLLSDLGLPDGSGLDLMRTLRQRGLTLPGIALSGYGQEQDLQQSRVAGFAAHLIKPVSLPKLEATVARVAGRA